MLRCPTILLSFSSNYCTAFFFPVFGHVYSSVRCFSRSYTRSRIFLCRRQLHLPILRFVFSVISVFGDVFSFVGLWDYGGWILMSLFRNGASDRSSSLCVWVVLIMIFFLIFATLEVRFLLFLILVDVIVEMR